MNNHLFQNAAIKSFSSHLFSPMKEYKIVPVNVVLGEKIVSDILKSDDLDLIKVSYYCLDLELEGKVIANLPSEWYFYYNGQFGMNNIAGNTVNGITQIPLGDYGSVFLKVLDNGETKYKLAVCDDKGNIVDDKHLIDVSYLNIDKNCNFFDMAQNKGPSFLVDQGEHTSYKGFYHANVYDISDQYSPPIGTLSFVMHMGALDEDQGDAKFRYSFWPNNFNINYSMNEDVLVPVIVQCNHGEEFGHLLGFVIKNSPNNNGILHNSGDGIEDQEIYLLMTLDKIYNSDINWNKVFADSQLSITPIQGDESISYYYDGAQKELSIGFFQFL